ncbi:hypothetical protein QBC35DRAFT_149297 [Podospora australis]|uniref:Uncharacterized protein n=1 Tax=Podospora australis TaxID=1536484 RepID=A0AAN7AJB0_9PEZI|nr:hypothetical protein QBC35DRAFT_149297 [Podospora australis]
MPPSPSEDRTEPFLDASGTTNSIQEKNPRRHHAHDILLTPRSTVSQYRSYLPARNLFWHSFPGGIFQRIPTPSENLLCAFHALVLSFAAQHDPSLSPPTLPQLQNILDDLRPIFEAAGMFNSSNLSGDQLAAVFWHWGKEFLPDQRCQLGYISSIPGWEEDEGGVPVLVGTGDIKEGEEVEEDIVRVWVWNDSLWEGGGMGHFEGVKRVDV